MSESKLFGNLPQWRVGLAVSMIAVATASITGASGRAAAQPGAVEEPAGTVHTIAGPGFCTKGDTVRDFAATSVRSLAVDDVNGVVLFDVGRREAGEIRRVDRFGASTLRTAAPSGPPGASPLEVPAAPDSARLATDRSGGVLLTTGGKVIGFGGAGGTGFFVVAGDELSSPGAIGTAGGDGGPATAARFASARSIATDEAGNVFVADRLDERLGTMRIRLVNRGAAPLTLYQGTPQELTIAPGHIDTIAGVAGAENSGDGGPALAASIAGVPPALAASSGLLYIALYSRSTRSVEPLSSVRVVNLGAKTITVHGVEVPAGIIGTIAGGRAAGFAGDGGPARSARFSYLPGIAADSSGSLYLADRFHHRVRRVDADGTITTVAGIGDTGPSDGGFNGNNRRAVEARLNRPADVEVGPNRHLFISDEGNGQLRVVDSGGLIRAGPGNDIAWRCTAKGPAGQAPQPRAAAPRSVTVAEDGTVYLLTGRTGQIMRVDPEQRITPVIGAPTRSDRGDTGTPSTDDDAGAVPAARARLDEPRSIVAAGRGVYIAEDGRVRFANLNKNRPLVVHGVRVPPGTVATVAGGKRLGPPSGPARQGELLLSAIDVNRNGDLFIADVSSQGVHRVDTAGAITTVAGAGGPPGLQECCQHAVALEVDDEGGLYTYAQNDAKEALWYVNLSGAARSVHGHIVPPGRAQRLTPDGRLDLVPDEGSPASESPLAGVNDLAADNSGNLYFSMNSVNEHAVRRIDDGGVLTTTAGTGTAGSGRFGFNGDGLRGVLTLLFGSSSVAVDRCGDVLVADSGNDRVRRIHVGRECASPSNASSAHRPPNDGATPAGNTNNAFWPVALVVLATAGVAGGIAAERRRRHR